MVRFQGSPPGTLQEWRNGRRAGLRIQFPNKKCGFESLLLHQKRIVMSDEVVKNEVSLLKFSTDYSSDVAGIARVTVPKQIIKKLFDYAVRLQRPHVITLGFSLGSVPLSYIEQEFRVTLSTFLKEFLLKFCVSNFLLSKIRESKLIVIGSPMLRTIDFQSNTDAVFSFDFSLFQGLTMQEWKLLPFKAPKRKNYRDIDRQVELFVKKESEVNPLDHVEQGDWVYFSLTILDEHAKPLIDHFEQYFWFRLHDEEVENILQSRLIDKKVGDSFLLDKTAFYDSLTMHVDGVFPLLLRVEHIISYRTLCFEKMKKHFRLKTQKDVARKLIEVFSFRNDLSQRHLIVDEAFKLLLNKHRFIPPHALVAHYEDIILSDIKKKLDYSVYKKEKKFSNYVRMLAEKQVREVLFSEMLAHAENLNVANDDVYNYLNLTTRQRTQQLLHFNLPITKMNGQEIPWAEEFIKHTCFREKALNYMIHYLTK